MIENSDLEAGLNKNIDRCKEKIERMERFLITQAELLGICKEELAGYEKILARLKSKAPMDRRPTNQ